MKGGGINFCTKSLPSFLTCCLSSAKPMDKLVLVFWISQVGLQHWMSAGCCPWSCSRLCTDATQLIFATQFTTQKSNNSQLSSQLQLICATQLNFVYIRL